MCNSLRTLLCGIFSDVSRHRIYANQPVHISWLKLVLSVNEISCMKLIARVEKVGLTWLGTTMTTLFATSTFLWTDNCVQSGRNKYTSTYNTELYKKIDTIRIRHWHRLRALITFVYGNKYY